MSSYIVIRLVPDSPVDGGTFSTYLDGLQIQVYPADGPQTPATLLGETQIVGSDVTLAEVPWLPGTYVASVSKIVESPTPLASGNYGTSLALNDGDGIAFGSVVVCPATSDVFNANTNVTDIPSEAVPTITLDQSIAKFVAADSVVTFYFAYGPGSSAPSSPTITPNYTGSNPSFLFNLNTSSAVSNATSVSFSATDGVAVGMQVTAASGIPTGTKVTAVTSNTSVTLNNKVTLASSASVTFTSELNSGVVQHIEQVAIDSFITFYVPIPASVATAIIPIPTPAANTYLDISVVATRNGITIPVPSEFYNVIVSDGTPLTPDQYQAVPLQETSLYITLPAPPDTDAISLVIPTDGTAPPFDGLFKAMQQAIKNDPVAFPPSTDISMLSVNQCVRMSYDIVWSQYTALPAPPDPLESLYTNPPNPGGSNGSSGTNNLEQDRQKFEGTLSSFYATANATAERLTKFVAAVSTAIFCEQTSLNATAALLEFPVDPSSTFATSVESELLLQGINAFGTGGVNFGVPAAHFYALAANLDKSTTALQRFQQATGDAIERLLQQFAAAETAGVIAASEAFTNPNPLLSSITSFQAARRLVALGVSAASTSPSVVVFAASPLAKLATDWLATPDPTPIPPPNPPLTYQNTDFNIWAQQLGSTDPQGYLHLDLDTLTQGYVIPSFTASPSGGAGATLTFPAMKPDGTATGIGVGMPVSGTVIAPGTTVTNTVTDLVIELSLPVLGIGVSTTNPITFTSATLQVIALPAANVAAGQTLTFAWIPATDGITTGMTVSGTGIAGGTTVSTTAPTTTVTLSAPALGSVSTADVITFNTTTPTVTATTTADCPSATKVLTFAGPGTTTGIQAGMSVVGLNIPAGTTVESVSSPEVTLSNAVSGDVPAVSVVTFVMLPVASLLADQIAAWLPSTTSPPTPSPTVATLKQVTATQWINFFTFTGNPTWLPPFTQPVAPGSSPTQASQKAGYIALRIRAFIRAVQLFFTVSSVPTSPQLPVPGAAPTFDLPAFNPIGEAVSSLPGSFKFGGSINSADLTSAVQNVFPNDMAAQAWLSQAMTTINEVWQIASVVPNPPAVAGEPPISFSFSVAEALFARGFRTASDITKLSSGDFQQSLTGTVAYDFANSGTPSLYEQAQSMAPASPPSGATGGSFQPINPDGSLVNCVPPPCLSPLGPIAYLQELLKLSPASTCDNPWATPATGQITLGDAVTARRGPVGTLAASCANLETPLPLIDLVNECLEYLGATQPPASATQPAPSGTVYDTSADQLAGYKLCDDEDCPNEEAHACHEPAAIFAALPEYSSPATPVTGKNDGVEPLVYNNLKIDFSSCHLPYSQALDVSRTYLRHFGSCRFEELRTFRKCITEFALDPANPPAGFQSYLWRLPVQIGTAIEYLGITPEEYALLFQGTAPQLCGNAPTNPTQPTNPNQPTNANQLTNPNEPANPTQAPTAFAAAPAGPSVAELYGYSGDDRDSQWSNEVVVLSEFLSRTCLTYCEFLDLWKATFGQSSAVSGTEKGNGAYPECEPCCLKDYQLQLPQGDARQQVLLQLAVFIRLWRKLKEVCGAGYTFEQLYDICAIFKLFNGGVINPEFIRQLAAFQMLRDQFNLPLVDHSDHATGTTGADRTHLLALWVGSGAKKWKWAVARLLEGVESHARTRYGYERPRGEGIAHMADNLDALSRLAGFNPPTATTPSTDTWNSSPGCTLRFAEVLAKMSASRFRIGELLYLFNGVPPQDCEDPFSPQDPEEARNYPLDLPEHNREHSLWRLREELLAVEVEEEEVRRWTWPRLVAEFRENFGYQPPAGQDPLLSVGQHFFPEVLCASGFSVTEQQRQYRTGLTSSTSWNSPPGSPFQYDATSSVLWMQLPLSDEAVAGRLGQLPALNSAEQAAVQDLYFAPRVDLAFMAFLFPDWQAAEIHLIQECDEAVRWHYFRRHFVLANARRKVIARHLAKHVAHHSGCHIEELEGVAELVLSNLLSDENTGTPWESDAGVPPTVMWMPLPSGGAIPALLGLMGTGLLGEYQGPQPATDPGTAPASGSGGATYPVLWREVRGPLEAFGHERDITNSPVPTVLPALALSPAPNPVVMFNNGYAIRNSDAHRLGGAEAIRVRWSGVLLVEREGEYLFRAGAPTREGEEPDFGLAEKSQWRVMLRRGQKSWVVLSHQWPGETEPERCMPRLRPGAYSIVVEYNQPAPAFAGSHAHPQRTGFQIKYAGPDSDGCLIALPVKHLYRDFQDQTLDQGISFLPGNKNAQAFLKAFYTSTIRDMRRTYQRAFKAVLFAGRLNLSARRDEECSQSELGYMFANPTRFAGYAYYRTSSTTFTQHLANFNFNFLPLQDNYHEPVATPGDRSHPSLQQTQAMFDWWERLFDYDLMRTAVQRFRKGPVWHLFHEAQVEQPADAADLLRHIDADPKLWEIDLRYCQDQSTPIYTVSSSDLEDERWLLRAWHADRWMRGLMNHFHARNISQARPDLWASADPSAPMPASGVSTTGNANLLAFLADG